MMNQKPALITEPIPYKTLFPWLNLFRVFRLAVDFQKIILACAAILLFMLGNQLFNQLPFAPQQPVSNRSEFVHQRIEFPPRNSDLFLHSPQQGLTPIPEQSPGVLNLVRAQRCWNRCPISPDRF